MKSAVSLMNGKTCRGLRSVTTRRPQKGGRGTGLSVAICGALAAAPRIVSPYFFSDSRGVVCALARWRCSVPDGVQVPAGDGVHHVQAVEGVLAVEQGAAVEVGQVVLGVVAGERRAAQQDRRR